MLFTDIMHCMYTHNHIYLHESHHTRMHARMHTQTHTHTHTHLRLDIISSEDIPNGPKCRGNDTLAWVHEELHKAPTKTSVYNALDLVVGAISKKCNRPTTVGEYVRIIRLKQKGQCW